MLIHYAITHIDIISFQITRHYAYWLMPRRWLMLLPQADILMPLRRHLMLPPRFADDTPLLPTFR